MRMQGKAECRMVWLLCVTLAIVGSADVGAQSGSEDELFYYSDGRRIDLVPASFVAARFTTEEAPDLSQRLPGFQLTEVRELPIQGLILYRFDPATPASPRDTLTDRFRDLPEVDLVAPVFRALGALMIVTDQFIARFAEGASPEAIQKLHDEHGVEEVDRAPWSERTYVLRAMRGDALQISNRYHESELVEYAHPDFVQVLDRAPRPKGPPNQRRVILDGAELPADTVVEKGTIRYLISEPGSLVLEVAGTVSGSQESQTSVARVTEKYEGFEGAFPNTWVLGIDPTWDDESYRPYAGSWSGYAVGSTVAPPGPYPPNVSPHMTYGPFSLADAEDARVSLQTWIRAESSYDFFGIYASTNGTNFHGNTWSGDWASYIGGDGWMNIMFDLKRVYTLGDLRGEEEVWISLGFFSDESVQFEGVYVDEVTIEKITGGYENLTSDQYDDLQWSLNNNEQLWGVEGADIRAVDAWGVTHGSSAITIAVIDEGVDLTHPDLASKLVAGYDATGGGSGGGPSGDDAHGTGCAGIAAALTDNALGVAGVDRQARIMPVRAILGGSAQTSWLADGISWAATNGADVLSNSWGGMSPVSAITDAIANAKSAGRGGLGSVVVFSTGNDNAAVSYPANLDTTLAVGALSPCDERKAPTSCDGEFGWGSNFGGELDIMAPGVHMYTTDISGAAGYASGDYFYNFNGTSSATPVVSGVASLVLGLNPSLTAVQVESILKSEADDLGATGWDSETGWGRVNAHQAVLATPPVGIDLVAGDVYFRDEPGGAGSVVPNLNVGQEVYPHFEFSISSSSSITGTITLIEIDGGTLCSWNGTLDPGLWITWCASPWTALAGGHELRGLVDPNDEFNETDESNNATSRDYAVGTSDIFADGFESGDTSAWSSTVP